MNQLIRLRKIDHDLNLLVKELESINNDIDQFSIKMDELFPNSEIEGTHSAESLLRGILVQLLRELIDAANATESSILPENMEYFNQIRTKLNQAYDRFSDNTPI